jgi:hypothetical protein
MTMTRLPNLLRPLTERYFGGAWAPTVHCEVSESNPNTDQEESQEQSVLRYRSRVASGIMGQLLL